MSDKYGIHWYHDEERLPLPVTIPVRDDTDPKRTVWLSVRQSNYGLEVTAFRHPPQEEEIDFSDLGEMEAMATLHIDVFDNQIKVQIHDEDQITQNPEGEAYSQVTLVYNIDLWRPRGDVKE